MRTFYDEGEAPEGEPTTNDSAGVIHGAPVVKTDPGDSPEAGGKLTPAEQAILREAAASKTEPTPGAVMKAAWEKIVEGRKESASDDGQQGKPVEGDGASSSEGDVDAFLREATGDVVTSEQLDVLGKFSAPFERKLDAIYAAQGEDAMMAELDKGDAQVLKAVYHDNDAERAEGLETISQAVANFEAATGAEPESVLNAINESGALADLRTHIMLLNMARSMVKQAQ